MFGFYRFYMGELSVEVPDEKFYVFLPTNLNVDCQVIFPGQKQTKENIVSTGETNINNTIFLQPISHHTNLAKCNLFGGKDS